MPQSRSLRDESSWLVPAFLSEPFEPRFDVFEAVAEVTTDFDREGSLALIPPPVQRRDGHVKVRRYFVGP